MAAMLKSECADLFKMAHEAGMIAGEAARPMPMHVVEHANPFDDNSAIVRRYAPVMDGICGFAWINIRPARGAFVNWLKSQDKGHKGYHGGYDVWVGAFGQSLERKQAYAHAFAEILRENGIKAFAYSRMD